MTRIGPARIVSPEAFAGTLVWFPIVGLVLGLLATFAVFALGGFVDGAVDSSRATAGALLYVGLSAWLTRGLHWDGLSDVADAWGSGAQGEKFWQIMKDSRCGAFGVLGLVFFAGGQLLVVRESLQLGAWGALVFAPIAGRVALVCLAWAGRSLSRPGLGQSFLAGATPFVALSCLLQATVAGFLLMRWEACVFVLVLSTVVVGGLVRLGRRNGGVNGDLLGASIVCSETAVFFAVCVLY
ncbi:adenosylcobinamide-GDP ribazoletransferase [Oceanidesulfovibrio indonesiensis]|nr:adenosylcobinamide-GDP ribazoletransferase [Oceanidesulfovibrio indonesiensis]